MNIKKAKDNLYRKLGNIPEKSVKKMNLLLKSKHILVTIFTCVILSIAGYALPTTALLTKHTTESAQELLKEGLYPQVMNSPLDNFTDALMINTASYDGNEALLDRAFSNYRYVMDGSDDPIEALNYRYTESDSASCPKIAYDRYWHGYVPFIRSALLVTNYSGIRQMNMMFHIILFVSITVLLVLKGHALLCIPYTVFWIALNPIALQLSLQYSTVYYVLSGAVILLLYKDKEIDSVMGYHAFFIIIGIVTSWLDLLTYPIVTLGIPLTILIFKDKGEDYKKQIKWCITLSIAWSVGYFGMWFLKWILSSLMLHRNIIAEAMNRAAFRTSSSYNGNSWTKLQILQRNSQHFQHKSFYLLIGTVFFIWIYLLAKRGGRFGSDAKLLMCIPYLLIAFMPVCWYFVMANHSWVHHFFTFRSLSVSIFSLLSLLMKIVENKKPIIKETQNG